MISWTDFLLVPVTMSFDCMTVGATDGIKEWNLKWWKIILCSFLFGLFQAVMPVIGYFIGYWIQRSKRNYCWLGRLHITHASIF